MRRWLRRRALLVALLLVGGWLCLAGWMLVSARADSQRGFDELSAARRDPSFSALLGDATATRVDRARRRFDDAHGRLTNPLVAPLRWLPVLGRQIRSADRVDEAASSATSTAADALSELRRLSRPPTPTGRGRVRLVRSITSLVQRGARRLEAVDPGSGTGLIGSLAKARTDLLDKRQEVLGGLERARQVTTGLADLLQGPRRYLLLGANNAEMRAGSGMFLSATTLDTSDGRLHLGRVQATDQLILPPESVPVVGDLARNWSWLDPSRDFRNLALTPDFPVSARLAAQMWQRVPGGSKVDGVVAVDVDGLRALLRAVGPVTVGGVQYTAPTIREQLLHRQYRDFDKDRAARRDRLGDVARAVFARVEHGQWKVDRLATELIGAAQGRHLLLWSARASAERAWGAAAVDGQLDTRSLSVALVNRGGNKLDFFLRQDVDVRTRRVAAGTEVTVTATLDNRTRLGEPRYVSGPSSPDLREGEYAGILVVNAPQRATALRMTGGSYDTFNGRDGPTEAVGRFLTLGRGRRLVLRTTFRLPASARSMVVEPTARAPEARWTINGRHWRLEKRRTIRW